MVDSDRVYYITFMIKNKTKKKGKLMNKKTKKLFRKLLIKITDNIKARDYFVHRFGMALFAFEFERETQIKMISDKLARLNHENLADILYEISFKELDFDTSYIDEVYS